MKGADGFFRLIPSRAIISSSAVQEEDDGLSGRTSNAPSPFASPLSPPGFPLGLSARLSRQVREDCLSSGTRAPAYTHARLYGQQARKREREIHWVSRGTREVRWKTTRSYWFRLQNTPYNRQCADAGACSYDGLTGDTKDCLQVFSKHARSKQASKMLEACAQVILASCLRRTLRILYDVSNSVAEAQGAPRCRRRTSGAAHAPYTF